MNAGDRRTKRKMIAWAGRKTGIGFLVHSHMQQYACGFKPANDGYDIRAIQHYLGRKNIKYTAMDPGCACKVPTLRGGMKPLRIPCRPECQVFELARKTPTTGVGVECRRILSSGFS